MPTEITIRPLTAADHPDWHRLWTAYLAFYETSVPVEVYETSFARLLSPDANEYQCLIAEIDGIPVGLAHYLYHRFMWTVADTCYLMDLFTDPGLRGKGVARALIAAVHAAAKRDGISTTYWNTQGTNVTARKIYDQVATLTPFLTYEKTD